MQNEYLNKSWRNSIRTYLKDARKHAIIPRSSYLVLLERELTNYALNFNDQMLPLESRQFISRQVELLNKFKRNELHEEHLHRENDAFKCYIEIWYVFNVGQATHWATADGLGVNPKADPETIGLAILILGQVARPSLCQGTPRVIIGRELGGHCTHDWFYMYQTPLAYMVVFNQWRVSNPDTQPTGLPWPPTARR